jgi:ATP-dependent RNA helicase DeaD
LRLIRHFPGENIRGYKKGVQLYLKTFDILELDQRIQSAIDQLGFAEMTPIQKEAIPPGLAGKDILGQAPAGTGKTVAFGIPLVDKVDPKLNRVQGVVICPTRELAMQVARELNKLGGPKGVRALAVYGGQPIKVQIRELKRRPQIIVGTPGRLLDHLNRRTIRLGQVSVVVLDEADEMLDMGFIEDITAILAKAPQERQTLLFSATIPREIEALAREFMKDPVTIRIKPTEIVVPGIKQEYIEVAERRKFDVLCNLLDVHCPQAAIVFARTKQRVDEVTAALSARGYSAEAIHGDLPQSKRDAVMGRFRSGSLRILVATDVAARGLDIDDVTHVYNFDIPQDPESYVHRIGRTGRAGRSGTATTFITRGQRRNLRIIESRTRGKIQRQPAPTLNDAIKGQRKLAREQLVESLEHDNHNYHKMADELLQEYDAVDLVSAALRLLTKEPNTTPVQLSFANAPDFEERKGRKKSGRWQKRGYKSRRGK